ncbi:hypothetical protein [Streptomyces sp. NPDC018347]|uniref:hypothetical protein n=1 Tax=Streptomyces sp. NPDC018347 TaxID=3157193 RepID=UPI0033CF4FFF
MDHTSPSTHRSAVSSSLFLSLTCAYIRPQCARSKLAGQRGTAIARIVSSGGTRLGVGAAPRKT